MDEILGVLMIKAKVEAEEAQRALVSSLNGLAGLMLLEGGIFNRVRAVETYREAVRLIEQNKKDVGTDKLQQLHTFHNLAMLLKSGVPGVPRTLRDDDLEAQAVELRNNYLLQRQMQLASAQLDYDKTLDACLPFHSHESWFLTALDMLADANGHTDLLERVKMALSEQDVYRRKSERNASNMAAQFKSVKQLKVLLVSALEGIECARQISMQGQQDLITATLNAAPDFVEQAGACHRCRGNLGFKGRLCEHCKLDEHAIAWETRLFALYTRALQAGDRVTAEDAARREQVKRLQMVGRGGLGEEGGANDDAGLETGARREEGVSGIQVLWKPSEAEQVLRQLATLLGRQYSGKAQHAGQGPSPSASSEEAESVLALAKGHLDRLEAQRKLFAQARALTLTQRTLLYARDELGMAVARVRLRLPGEQILQHEENFKIHEDEIPLRNKDLSDDKIIAQGGLDQTLGRLRYLNTLKGSADEEAQADLQAPTVDEKARPVGVAEFETQPEPLSHDRQAVNGVATEGTAAEAALEAAPQGTVSSAAGSAARAVVPAEQEAGMAAAATTPGSAGVTPARVAGMPATTGASGLGAKPGTKPAEVCPICHDCIGRQFSMLPCGHVVCCDCCALLVGRVPSNVPPVQRRIACPNCRMRVHLTDVAYVDAGGTARQVAPVALGHTTSSIASVTPGQQFTGAAAGAVNSGLVTGAAQLGRSLWAGEADVFVSGSYGTKIGAIVRRIIHITRTDDTAKVVVFSSWSDMLELLAHAFQTNRVPFAFARARQGFQDALAAFKSSSTGSKEDIDADGLVDKEMVQEGLAQEKEDGLPQASSPLSAHGGMEQEDATLPDMRLDEAMPDERVSDAVALGGEVRRKTASKKQSQGQATGGGRRRKRRGRRGGVQQANVLKLGTLKDPRVLLLLMSQGGAGLNLTEAQHVILVEPRADPASELQAVGRVHRIGQLRETHVHRFVVCNTVEENVHALSCSRSTAMDMSSVHSAGRKIAGMGGEGHLTVRDVAALLRAPWSGVEGLATLDQGGRADIGGAGEEVAGDRMALEVGNGHDSARVDARQAAAIAAAARWRAAQSHGQDVPSESQLSYIKSS